jgi:hypothetical protein
LGAGRWIVDRRRGKAGRKFYNRPFVTGRRRSITMSTAAL